MDREKTRKLLEETLRTASTQLDRLPILLELAGEPTRNDPAFGLQCAREALTIAQSLKDPYWTACSLQSIGIRMAGESRYSETRSYLERASDLFGSINAAHMQAKAELHIVMIDVFSGQFEAALTRLLRIAPVLEQIRDRSVMIRTHQYFGHIYKGAGYPGKALESYQRALHAAREADMHSHLAYLYRDIAMVYRETGDSNSQREFLFKSLEAHRATNDEEGISTTMINIASQYLEQHRYTLAEPYVREAQMLCHKLGFVANEACTWGQLGEIMHRRSHSAESVQCYQTGMALAVRSEHVPITATLFEHYGTVCMENGDLQEARMYLLRALDMISGSGHNQQLHGIHRTLAELYEKSGDMAAALNHHKHYTSLREQWIREEQILEAGRVEMQTRLNEIHDNLQEERSERSRLIGEMEKKEQELVALTLKLVQQGQCQNGTRRSNGTEEQWDLFARQFHKVHHGFYSNLVRSYPELTPSEVKVCSLIRIGLTSKEIASLLGVSKRTVDSHREHIHKKLNISTRLATFIAQL